MTQIGQLNLSAHPMKKSFWRWAGWFLFLFVLDFTLPFVFLNKIQTVLGSFLFWLVWIVVAIISMFVIFLQWQDTETRKDAH
ncbi:MAG: hypothetical protein AB1427_17835 [Thermodesulfobacteriota bacterium]